MKIKKLIGVILFIFCLQTTHLRAQSFSSDRPGAGDGVATVEARYFQVETGLDFSKLNPGEKAEFTVNSLPVMLLRYGLSEKVELRIIESFVIHDKPNWSEFKQGSGFSNLTIGGKFQVCENPEIATQAGVLAEVFVPTGSAEVTEDALGLSLRFLHSWDFAARWNLGSNFGAYWFEEQELSLMYSFALGYTITDKLGVFVEPYGNYVQLNDFELSFDGGFSYLIKPNLQVDINAGTGITGDHYFIGFGFSWLIGKI
ncbi:MAG: transporter [Bacteroidales bacterium]|nr:transporter [Bacteroidales bacterium]